MTAATAHSSTADITKTIRQLLTECKLNKQQSTQSQQQISEKQDAIRLEELRRLFASLIQRGDLVWNCHLKQKVKTDDKVSEAKTKWSQWLQSQHDAFVRLLCQRVLKSKKYAMRIFMSVIATSVSRDADLVIDHYEQEYYRETPLKTQFLVKLLDVLCLCDTSPETAVVDYDSLINLFIQEFARPYKDVQYMSCIVLKDLAKEYQGEIQDPIHEATKAKLEHLFYILERVPMLTETSQTQLDELDHESAMLLIIPKQVKSKAVNDIERQEAVEETDEEDESDDEQLTDEASGNDSKARDQSISSNTRVKKTAKSMQRTLEGKSFSLTKQKTAMERAWLSTLVFTSNISTGVQKRLLIHISQNVLHYVINPLLFAQYFTKSYKQQEMHYTSQADDDDPETESTSWFASSSIACLALEGLFCLMTEHGLEYPKFFQSLYALLQPSVFYAKHRMTFFRLLNKSLSSSEMLPVYLVAAMCKRLCRCALAAPPSGALFAVALVTNLLQRHKACRCLVHRNITAESEDGGKIKDVFDNKVEDPLLSRGKLISCAFL